MTKRTLRLWTLSSWQHMLAPSLLCMHWLKPTLHPHKRWQLCCQYCKIPNYILWSSAEMILTPGARSCAVQQLACPSSKKKKTSCSLENDLLYLQLAVYENPCSSLHMTCWDISVSKNLTVPCITLTTGRICKETSRLCMSPAAPTARETKGKHLDLLGLSIRYPFQTNAGTLSQWISSDHYWKTMVLIASWQWPTASMLISRLFQPEQISQQWISQPSSSINGTARMDYHWKSSLTMTNSSCQNSGQHYTS